MRILVIALSGIGDALMFTPALKLLRQNLPDSKIDTLVMFSGARDLYQRLPYVDNVLFHNFMNSSYVESLNYVLSLRNKYDASINVYPSNRKEYNLINFLIGAKKRIGVRYLRNNFMNMGFLNNLVISENDDTHNVETNIHLAEFLTNKPSTHLSAMEFPLCENDLNFAELFMKEKTTDDQLCIGFHPGCSVLKNHINRRWEPQKFAALADKLVEKYNANIFIFGGPDEQNLKEEIVRFSVSDKVISVNTKNLGQTAALIKRMNVFVSNDSSLMHVASALGLKVVAIVGPTNTNYIKPWKTDYRIASLNLECAPCFFYSPKPLTCTRADKKYKCIQDLEVDMVFKEVEKFL